MERSYIYANMLTLFGKKKSLFKEYYEIRMNVTFIKWRNVFEDLKGSPARLEYVDKAKQLQQNRDDMKGSEKGSYPPEPFRKELIRAKLRNTPTSVATRVRLERKIAAGNDYPADR